MSLRHRRLPISHQLPNLPLSDLPRGLPRSHRIRPFNRWRATAGRRAGKLAGGMMPRRA